MSFGPKSVTAVAVTVAAIAAGAIWALPAHAPDPGPQRPSLAVPHPASCKPLPPVAVDAVAAPGSDGRWSLALRSLDQDRDVQVWMQTSPADRRMVWSGRLAADEERHVEVDYAVSAAAERVVVTLEPSDMGAAIVRGLAVAAVPATSRAHARLAEKPAGVLLEDPATGARVRQFTGAVGEQR